MEEDNPVVGRFAVPGELRVYVTSTLQSCVVSCTGFFHFPCWRMQLFLTKVKNPCQMLNTGGIPVGARVDHSFYQVVTPVCRLYPYSTALCSGRQCVDKYARPLRTIRGRLGTRSVGLATRLMILVARLTRLLLGTRFAQLILMPHLATQGACRFARWTLGIIRFMAIDTAVVALYNRDRRNMGPCGIQCCLSFPQRLVFRCYSCCIANTQTVLFDKVGLYIRIPDTKYQLM